MVRLLRPGELVRATASAPGCLSACFFSLIFVHLILTHAVSYEVQIFVLVDTMSPSPDSGDALLIRCRQVQILETPEHLYVQPETDCFPPCFNGCFGFETVVLQSSDVYIKLPIVVFVVSNN
jgi:hypothetical protein